MSVKTSALVGLVHLIESSVDWQWQKDAADVYHALMEAVALSGDAVRVCTLKCCVSKAEVLCHVPTGWLCIPERRECLDADCQESGEL